MNWRDIVNIQVGVNNRKKQEHQTRMYEERIAITYLVHAAGLVKNPKTFDQIYPLESDKKVNQNKETSYNMPLEMFGKLLISLHDNG